MDHSQYSALPRHLMIRIMYPVYIKSIQWYIVLEQAPHLQRRDRTGFTPVSLLNSKTRQSSFGILKILDSNIHVISLYKKHPAKDITIFLCHLYV